MALAWGDPRIAHILYRNIPVVAQRPPASSVQRTTPQRMTAEEIAPQPPRIGVAHVVDPALNAGVQIGERDAAGAIEIDVSLQTTSEIDHVSPPAVSTLKKPSF